MKLIDHLNSGDHFASGIGAKLVEIRPGYARAELTVEDRHINGAGVCQGGVMYTLADLSFAAVTNSHGFVALGISNTITFMKSAKLGETIKAECTEVLDHHKLPYCDIHVTNQNGELLAVMTGLAYRLKAELVCDSLM